MNHLVIGQDYYFISNDDYVAFTAAIEAANMKIGDFGCFQVTQSGYAGYYFVIDEINGDEWDILSSFNSFTTIAVFESVQANYLG